MAKVKSKIKSRLGWFKIEIPGQQIKKKLSDKCLDIIFSVRYPNT